MHTGSSPSVCVAPSRQGQWHYAFVVDGRGWTLYHPLLPSRFTAADDGDRPLLDIADLETAKEAKRVIDSMKRYILYIT